MLKLRSLLLMSAAVALAAAVKIASGQAGATPAQPKVEAPGRPGNENQQPDVQGPEPQRLSRPLRGLAAARREACCGPALQDDDGGEGGAHADHVIQRERPGRLNQQPEHSLSDPPR